jgi:hypothetical protein
MPAEPRRGLRPSGRHPEGRYRDATAGTARPEGGGRAVSGDHPAPARQWPLLTVLGGVMIGLLVVWAGAFRPGLLVVGAFMLLGAVLRRLVPSVGMLAVRSRFTDLITYGLLGVVIMLLALMAQPKPILKATFLDGIFRFLLRG